jgi:hypothetical protein
VASALDEQNQADEDTAPVDDCSERISDLVKTETANANEVFSEIEECRRDHVSTQPDSIDLPTQMTNLIRNNLKTSVLTRRWERTIS